MTRRGLFVPPFDALSEPSVCAELARDAEAAGWDGFFVWDHLLYSEPVRAIADPWIVCAAVALATERIQFGPMVTPLSRRRTQVLARQAVSLDRLSQGRLVLGFGLGDDGPLGELSSFGDDGSRAERLAARHSCSAVVPVFSAPMWMTALIPAALPVALPRSRVVG